ncbi:hypothetical protein EYF80_010501 [Liparis tanakae]|uniref:Secreted protein n=1 Tax=Liparis tanakae TaxID=230148 RepID=A0A4Z2IN00_9TELE|nr:hypothetical protein EYF80_010501 [Liparis tanakae]
MRNLLFITLFWDFLPLCLRPCLWLFGHNTPTPAVTVRRAPEPESFKGQKSSGDMTRQSVFPNK